MFEKTGQKTVPNVFVNGTHIGGCDNTMSAHADGRLAKLLQKDEEQKKQVEVEPEVPYDYDMIVIGGGSGGLACSKVLIFLIYKTPINHKYKKEIDLLTGLVKDFYKIKHYPKFFKLHRLPLRWALKLPY